MVFCALDLEFVSYLEFSYFSFRACLGFRISNLEFLKAWCLEFKFSGIIRLPYA